MTTMEKDRVRIIAEGLAAEAMTRQEMSPDDVGTVRSELVGQWRALGSPANAFRDAAALVGDLPRPEFETAEATERMRQVRERLGVTSAEDQLVAALAARELLQSLSEQYG